MTKATSKVISNDLSQDNLANNSVGEDELQNNSVGTVNIKDKAVVTQKLADRSVTAIKLADQVIVENKVSDNAITSSKIANNAITTNKLNNNSVTTDKIADNTIIERVISDNAITNTKIANNSVTDVKLASNSVTTQKIVNKSVTIEKLGSDGSAGAMLIDNGSAWSKLQAGSEGDLLTIKGDGLPGWISNVIPTGTILDYIGSTAPSGWLLCNGKTIGNQNSGASAYANSLAQALFVLLWNSFSDSEAIVIGGRGGSALSDFNANKQISLPDLRGRTLVGRDTMGNVPALRLPGGGQGEDTNGKTGGSARLQLNNTHLPKHAHAMFVSNTNDRNNVLLNSYKPVVAKTYNGNNGQYDMETKSTSIAEPTLGRTSFVGGDNTVSEGLGVAFDNTQPYMLSNKIIAI